jgi:adenylate cyclase
MSILIVDDSAAQRAALSDLLEAAGFTDLLAAGSADAALSLLARHQSADIDLILTDLYMPGGSGIAVCQRVKAMPAWRDTSIIVVTSSSETDDLDQAFAAGAIDYITKPPSEVELLARVRSALRLKSEMDRRKARERELEVQHAMLRVEQERSERLLLNILPRPIAERLKADPGIIAERFEAVTVLFADIVGFTSLAAASDPAALVQMLNAIFSRFDELAEQFGLEKIKTIGDAYMAVAGLPTPRPDHADAAAAMTLDMQRAIAELSDGRLQLRIGLHSGPVVAGVIGRRKFSYDLWGDTVNIASRMESHGTPGAIQLSTATYELLGSGFTCVPRGTISVKGRGPMDAWYLRGRVEGGLPSLGNPRSFPRREDSHEPAHHAA